MRYQNEMGNDIVVLKTNAILRLKKLFCSDYFAEKSSRFLEQSLDFVVIAYKLAFSWENKWLLSTMKLAAIQLWSVHEQWTDISHAHNNIDNAKNDVNSEKKKIKIK